MIHKAKFENFKGLRDVEVTFDSRFTVLVGPNGTGKTSVLQGVELVSEMSMSLTPTIPNWRQLRSKSDRSDQMIVRLEVDDRHGWQVEDPVSRNNTVKWAPVGISRTEKTGSIRINLPPNHYPDNNLGLSVRPCYSAAKIAMPTVTTTTPPTVQLDGTGVSSLMAYLKLRDDEIFDRVESEFRQLIPHVQKIRMNQISGATDSPAGNVFMFDTKDARHVPAEQMSDGTLYILALIVAVLGPHRPKTLLIDDIDMRLHPKAQYELVTLLKKFLEEFPDLQIIATSHSPYILDKLEPNKVRVTGLGEDGSVVIAPLTDHPSYEKWKDSMTPGEFWSHTGEEWLKKLKRETVSP